MASQPRVELIIPEDSMERTVPREAPEGKENNLSSSLYTVPTGTVLYTVQCTQVSLVLPTVFTHQTFHKLGRILILPDIRPAGRSTG